MEITIFGKGNMGQAIGKNFAEAGNNVQYYGSKDTAQQLGDIVVMAVPYPALAALAKQYQAELAGKIVVDITNPLNFETWDELVVPADSSAAQQLQELLPESKVLKAFNTNFAATLQSGKIGELPTTVLVAGDDEEAKAAFKSALTSSALRVLNAGKLKRAREMEATGFSADDPGCQRTELAGTAVFGVVGTNK